MIVHDNLEFLHYLTGILNSRIYFFYMKSVAGVLGDADKGGRLISQKSHILKFPVYNIKVDSPDNKARYMQMVQLVKSILKMHTNKAKASTQHDQEMIQRQIEATDRQIDALVYELYGLTAEEIAIVEGSTRK
ncbi:MAG: hypothetical protein QG657_339 [Acidobacteriota bacterium]|nr:hypothetical protein [Acidobacteriota bacterium]